MRARRRRLARARRALRPECVYARLVRADVLRTQEQRDRGHVRQTVCEQYADALRSYRLLPGAAKRWPEPSLWQELST